MASKELSDKISELNILNNEILNIISYTGIDIMFEPVTSYNGKRNRLKLRLQSLNKNKEELDIKINYLKSILEQFSFDTKTTF